MARACRKVAIAISETSKRPSRTMGLKARLMMGISAKFSRSRAEAMAPSFKARVRG
jgi:hypothetical protein